MRVTVLLLAFCTGALSMSDIAIADGQEKKEEKKVAPNPRDDKNFTEKVQIRRCETDTTRGKFLVTEAAKDVAAFKWDDGKTVKYYTRPKVVPTPGTEITDEAGKVWIVDRVIGGNTSGYYTSVVTPKAVEKKGDKKP